jgi:hypothetical protein
VLLLVPSLLSGGTMVGRSAAAAAAALTSAGGSAVPDTGGGGLGHVRRAALEEVTSGAGRDWRAVLAEGTVTTREETSGVAASSASLCSLCSLACSLMMIVLLGDEF